MKHFTQAFSADVLEDTLLEDETDELFSQLLHVEPPATLVNDILATLASFPIREANLWN